ncbi:DhNV_061 [Dikerogammarus haemobaphes nudivirus]|nr:DhNV_061 [Dikerogammarus haemobaphes nudivirus]
MKIIFLKHIISIPIESDIVTIYLKNYKNSNTVIESLTNNKQNIEFKNFIQINKECNLITFNIMQTSLHLLYKALKQFKGIKTIYVRCKYLKYSLNDVIQYMQNVGYEFNVKKLIFII